MWHVAFIGGHDEDMFELQAFYPMHVGNPQSVEAAIIQLPPIAFLRDPFKNCAQACYHLSFVWAAMRDVRGPRVPRHSGEYFQLETAIDIQCSKLHIRCF